jgi:alanine racemase
MDTLMVDLTNLPAVEVGDEVVLLGRQGAEEITAHEVAALARSVSYDVLAGWRHRLPRVLKGTEASEVEVRSGVGGSSGSEGAV